MSNNLIYVFDSSLTLCDTVILPELYTVKNGFTKGGKVQFLLQSNVNTYQFSFLTYHSKDSISFQKSPDNLFIKDIIQVSSDSIVYAGTTFITQLKLEPIYFGDEDKETNSLFIHASNKNISVGNDIPFDINFNSITAKKSLYTFTQSCWVFDPTAKFVFDTILCSFKNEGTQKIDSFLLKFRFRTCGAECASEKTFTFSVNANILPGENYIYTIPELIVEYQKYHTGDQINLCGWIVNPDDHLQFNLNNDFACETIVPIYTSIPELLDNAYTISISPNPVQDLLNINFEGSLSNFNLFKVLDVFGREVLSKEIAFKSQEYNLDVSNFIDGVYFINFYNEGKILAKKTIVKY